MNRRFDGICPRCGTNPKPNGRRSYCNPCNAGRLRAIAPAQRNRYLKAKYGITSKKFDEILKKQGGGCRGCGRKGVTKSLNVDHEHVPGYKNMSPKEKAKYVRMILCHNCNRLVGMAANSPQTLRNLADGLEEYYNA